RPAPRSGPLPSPLTGEFERDRVALLHARALLDTRLGAAALIGVLHGPEALPGLLRPAKLAPVVGGLFLKTSLHRRDLLDHLLGDHLEIRGPAVGAAHRAGLRVRAAPGPAHPHAARPRPPDGPR